MAMHLKMTPSILALLVAVVLALIQASWVCQAKRWEMNMNIRMPTDKQSESKEAGTTEEGGTTWAVLVAGSQGFGNYRHQADVCHAYQILKRGGLKDENIVVFMYDDIANNELNPRRGTIINHPNGQDVYAGVPKDYTGEHVTAQNFYAVLLGDKSTVKGGSGKVVASKPNDRIFIYYSDHGGPGVLGMPNMPYIYAKDFIEVLKKKHSSNSYKEMVIYVEACESGSVFEGMMPENINVYVTTASNAQESSWGTYCPGMDPAPPPEYMTCLGDLYSVAWMEDRNGSMSMNGLNPMEFLRLVKERTSNFNTFTAGSHVMEYGNKSIKPEKLYLYQGFDPATENLPANKVLLNIKMGVVNQRDADLLFLWKKYERSMDKPEKKHKILEEITQTMKHRIHLDGGIELIGKLLFGPNNGPHTLSSKRKPGMPLVDDWDCLKSMVRVFEDQCGSLSQYGMKHMRAFANICNEEISHSEMEEACIAACGGHNPGQ
ncbi:hypothetical protein Cgig2_002504 [Carnegiea gigantea]|uniref:Legumain prodomain domain-containing protein n=1 Tax=Carnegiea gigantea TaxID=171969 RepID=A0A9Q1KVI3_9CARY|nr:hypothetical protein Cgig2_002504 [Carnegiea gigantea]